MARTLTLLAEHFVWQNNMQTRAPGSHLTALLCLQNRMLIVLKSQIEALLGASIRLEETLQSARDAQRHCSSLSNGCHPQARSGVKDNELEDVKCDTPQTGVKSACVFDWLASSLTDRLIVSAIDGACSALAGRCRCHSRL